MRAAPWFFGDGYQLPLELLDPEGAHVATAGGPWKCRATTVSETLLADGTGHG